jgi:hypothetical protein
MGIHNTPHEYQHFDHEAESVYTHAGRKAPPLPYGHGMSSRGGIGASMVSALEIQTFK